MTSCLTTIQGYAETLPSPSYLQLIFEITTAASPMVMWLHFGCLATSYGSLHHPMVIRLQFAPFFLPVSSIYWCPVKKKTLGKIDLRTVAFAYDCDKRCQKVGSLHVIS